MQIIENPCEQLTDEMLKALHPREIMEYYFQYWDEKYLKLALDKGFFEDKKLFKDILDIFHFCRVFPVGELGFQKAIDLGLYEGETTLTRLILAAEANSMKYVKMELVASRNEYSNLDVASIALLGACKYGHIKIVEYLVEQGADVNYNDYGGYYPIHCASNFDSLGVVKYLVAHGADVNVRSKFGFTPLRLSKGNGTTEIYNFLIENGAVL